MPDTPSFLPNSGLTSGLLSHLWLAQSSSAGNLTVKLYAASGICRSVHHPLANVAENDAHFCECHRLHMTVICTAAGSMQNACWQSGTNAVCQNSHIVSTENLCGRCSCFMPACKFWGHINSVLQAQRFFAALPQRLAARLQQAQCIPTEGHQWVYPHEALVCQNPQVRHLLADTRLAAVMTLQYAHSG